MNKLRGTFSDSLRTLRSFIPARGRYGTMEETANFAHTDSNFELNSTDGGAVSEGATTETGETSSMSQEPILDSEGFDIRNRITEYQAGWNVTNAIQGMFIVSLPFAVLHGGYWALIAMLLFAYVCCYTGKILVECLYEPDINGVQQRVRVSYVEIAEEVWGKRIGGRIVNIAQLIELLMTCILYLVLCGDLFIGSFPDTPVNLQAWIIISAGFLIPVAFLRNLRSVSWLSFWNAIVHLIINLVILIYCFTRAPEWGWSKVKVKIDIWSFPTTLGIIVFSYTSQIFLPTLEGNMTRRDRFGCMLNWTHVAAAIFKSLFGYIGFLTWSDNTSEVITNNLPTREFKAIVNLILVVKALLSYPLPFYAAAELIETSMFKGRPATPFPSCYTADDRFTTWAISLRMLLVVLTLLLAIFIPHFALLMGLIGSVTGTMLSLIWPCYFHLKIKWYSLRWAIVAADVAIILLGVVCTIIGVYYSSHALIRALRFGPDSMNEGH